MEGSVPKKCISLFFLLAIAENESMYFFLNKKSSENFAAVN